MSHLWETEKLTKIFPVRGGFLGRKRQSLTALRQVSLYLDKGETLGIVGESGCGKSTFGRVLMGLYPRTAGRIYLTGEEVQPAVTGETMRRRLQMVFQDPYASLNPRMTVRQIIEEPLLVHRLGTGSERADRVRETLRQVGLRPEHGERYPHEFSGGQRQRVGIARALITAPDCIICDEPISALDVSIQVQIVMLLEKLQAEKGLAYVFISHDLSIVRYLSHRIAVMYMGAVVEEGPAEALYDSPLHPYTEALIRLNGKVVPGAPIGPVLAGELPNPLQPPEGCLFASRCPERIAACDAARPELTDKGGDRRVACLRR